MTGYYREKPEARRSAASPGVGRRPVVTWALLAANIVVWLAMEQAGGSQDQEVLLDFGALFGPLTASGEYWRLFTAMFLHVGLMHLLFNSFGLFIFGRLVEGVFGHVRFAVIYVLAGLSGSVASFLFNSIAIGAGASGAIFGVLGALAAFFVARRGVLGEMGRQNLSGILVIAAINLVYGFITPGIDNWAHMGGLVAGFAVGFAFVPQYRVMVSPLGMLGRRMGTRLVTKRWWVLPVVVTALFAGTWLGTATLADNAISHIRNAERLVNQRSYEPALDEIGRAIQIDPWVGEAYYLRGRILLELGDARRALSDLGTAVQLGLDDETRAEAIGLMLALRSRR